MGGLRIAAVVAVALALAVASCSQGAVIWVTRHPGEAIAALVVLLAPLIALGVSRSGPTSSPPGPRSPSP